jgi:hypothetical protein
MRTSLTAGGKESTLINADFNADLRRKQVETAKISAGSLLPQSAKISVPFLLHLDAVVLDAPKGDDKESTDGREWQDERRPVSRVGEDGAR